MNRILVACLIVAGGLVSLACLAIFTGLVLAAAGYGER